MSGESFCSLCVVAFSLRNHSSKSKGNPFVRFVLMHSLLGTKETNHKGFSLFSTPLNNYGSANNGLRSLNQQ